MKKYILFLLVYLLLPTCVNAKKVKVELDKCIDGDTISIKYNEIITKVRFLAIDAPEIDKEEPYSLDAKEFTCNLIKEGKNLYLEFDPKSDRTDKYDRMLAWVWIDDTLIQKEIVKNGYAKVAYLYEDYKYASELEKFEKYAKENKLNIWSGYNPEQKEKEKKNKKKEDLFDKLNKYYDVMVITLAMVLALITLKITKQKNNK